MRALGYLLALILAALDDRVACATAQDKQEVDLALAMGIDISGSIDPDEARLQREGYVNAFRDPAIMKAILGGANGRIAVSYYEWSDSWMQKLLIDWTLLDSEAAILAFATRLSEARDLDRAPHLDQRRNPLRHPAIRSQSLRGATQGARHFRRRIQQRRRPGDRDAAMRRSRTASS